MEYLAPLARAAIASREGTTDFNRYGTAMEPFARLVPFFNPSIQSIRRSSKHLA